MSESFGSSSARKHRAILEAAETLFLRDGYLGTSMDELAERSGVSKQTVYKHFGSKEVLFVELVTTMTAGASDNLDELDSIPDDEADLAPYFMQYAMDEMRIVMTPRLLRLRRLVIGEVSRFPELAQALFENGPQRSIQSLAIVISKLAQRGLLSAPSPAVAATTLNWLVLAALVNEAMLLGDEAIPTTTAMRAHAAEATRVFLTAYANDTGLDDLR
ncbi:TetR/AcrR family transcriptional regulator [Cryobacterium sp. TMT2-17-1]|uniref:TetR/AcrR family transcriptional regulator n=1 Tax=Cryobacterium sp. TMT2-17-1 TaxID=1259248 RepID=UPI00106C6C9E|nr:TetR/AcrR family transcriptional regulator [Cryobacterium sp. TMT2-17-1]TFC48608.1 TetR/AcrR family transcriptional regulator [Cryobacterium sp. TMT2-17-1]